jgi:hypothetical protein
MRGALAAQLAADERRNNADAVAAKGAGRRALRTWLARAVQVNTEPLHPYP